MVETAAEVEPNVDVRETGCCIVGAGPAGVVLAYLLARRGVEVTLLESHADFDRDFRGDTIHPSTLELLDGLGLADRLLQIPHGKLTALDIFASGRVVRVVDFGRLRTRFPYIAMLPQAKLLDFLVAEARAFPSFHLVLSAPVQRLVQEGGRVAGVRYRASDGWHELRSRLVVGADGRFSRVRTLAEIEPVSAAPPMDVLWFRLPKQAGDATDNAAFYLGNGVFAILLDRGEDWQVGYVVAKGSFKEIKSAGLPALRLALARQVPWLASRVDLLSDWKQVAVLSVESSRVPVWHRPGLLLIGDAAHVMSPVAGVGINYAIGDAVEAANVLAAPLARGDVEEAHLAEVQRRREWPVKVIQRFQRLVQARLVAAVLRSDRPFRLPLPVRIALAIPVLRDLPARLVAFGPRRPVLRDA